MLKSLKKVTIYSHILMLLTSVHHIYGAFIYHTPWRIHVLFVSLPVMAITAILTNRIQQKGGYKNRFLFWLNWSVILSGSIGLIGTFEGIYNHFIKDLLFIIGVDRKILLALFPPPKYEMPNDLFFEVTGVLQAVITVLLIIHFIRLTKYVLFRNSKNKNNGLKDSLSN